MAKMALFGATGSKVRLLQILPRESRSFQEEDFQICSVQRKRSWLKSRIMSSTSQKHRNFVSEPMGEKPVTELAGIGPVLGGKLEDKGFDKAYVVLGQFLVLKKDEEMFMDWIKDTCGANKKQGSDCYNCLKEWCDAFL